MSEVRGVLGKKKKKERERVREIRGGEDTWQTKKWGVGPT